MSDSSKTNPTEKDVNNEEIINDLTKDLESSLSTSDRNVETPTSSNSDSSANFIIDPDGRGSSPQDSQHPDFQFKNKIPNDKPNVEDFDKDEEDEKSNNCESEDEDYEIALKDIESTLSDSEKENRKLEAERFKNDGNDKFKTGDYEESLELYTNGLKICPLAYNKERAVLYSNRAATKMKLNKNKDAIKDCTKAIENDDKYIKAYYRRAQCNEQTDQLDESLGDFKKILELDSDHVEARKATVRLPPLIEERNERMKTEMLSKLKDLGNLVLKPFGLSTENFKLTQDPDTKGYSINFQQNK